MWVCAVGLGLLLVLIQRLDFKRTRGKLLSRSGDWNVAAVENHVIRSMGLAVWAVWLLLTLIWPREVETTIYGAVTATMVGAGAALAMAPYRGRSRSVSVRELTWEKLAREIAAVRRAGVDAMFWGFVVSVMVAAGTGIAIAGASHDLTEQAWLIAGLALGVYWLRETALAYKNAALRFMDDNRGLDEEIQDIDDLTRNPKLAPEPIGLLLPILPLMEMVVKRVTRRNGR